MVKRMQSITCRKGGPGGKGLNAGITTAGHSAAFCIKQLSTWYKYFVKKGRKHLSMKYKQHEIISVRRFEGSGL